MENSGGTSVRRGTARGAPRGTLPHGLGLTCTPTCARSNTQSAAQPAPRVSRRPRSAPVGSAHGFIRSRSERSRGRGMVPSRAACKWAARTRSRPRAGGVPAVAPPLAPGLLQRLCAARGAERPPAPWENGERDGRGGEDGAGDAGRRGDARGRDQAGERGRRVGRAGRSLAGRRAGARVEGAVGRGAMRRSPPPVALRPAAPDPHPQGQTCAATGADTCRRPQRLWTRVGPAGVASRPVGEIRCGTGATGPSRQHVDLSVDANVPLPGACEVMGDQGAEEALFSTLSAHRCNGVPGLGSRLPSTGLASQGPVWPAARAAPWWENSRLHPGSAAGAAGGLGEAVRPGGLGCCASLAWGPGRSQPPGNKPSPGSLSRHSVCLHTHMRVHLNASTCAFQRPLLCASVRVLARGPCVSARTCSCP